MDEDFRLEESKERLEARIAAALESLAKSAGSMATSLATIAANTAKLPVGPGHVKTLHSIFGTAK